jgi:hypothetical protein
MMVGVANRRCGFDSTLGPIGPNSAGGLHRSYYRSRLKKKALTERLGLSSKDDFAKT